MSSSDITFSSGAEDVIWDLTDLYAPSDYSVLHNDLKQVVLQAEQFRNRWYGNLGNCSVQDLCRMITEYESVVEQMDKLGSYTNLLFSTDSENVEYGKNYQMARETMAMASSHLHFVGIEINGWSDQRVTDMLSHPDLARWKHWLERVREYKAYTLTEDMERVLSAKSITSRASWVRLHDQISNRASYMLNGQELSFSEVVKLSYDPDRPTRKAAVEALSAGLKRDVEMHGFVLNTILADCYSTDRLRGFPTWISSRNLDNEVSDVAVEGLVTSVVNRFDLVHRYYALKQRLLGYDTFHDYDRNAPIGSVDKRYTWSEAQSIVTDAYTSFDPELGRIVQRFFQENWIHAPVKRGKRSGAYSAGTIASVHPYVFMNFTGTARDVQTLAHELGHGVHQYLSREQGPLLMDTPLTIAETASVFGEMITYMSLYQKATTSEERLGLLMSKLDAVFATVSRQIALNRFEDAVHCTRREEGELSVQRIGELWMQTQKAQFGDAVIFSEGFSNWWSYISHFIHTPGYVYAYAFGELLVLALYDVYLAEPQGFPEKYRTMLRAGGSLRPTELLEPFGLDIDDPSFWGRGLSVIERFVHQAEQLANERVTQA